MVEAVHVRNQIIACERFGQWPFSNPPHAMTMAQMSLLAAALKQEPDRDGNRAPKGKLPKRTMAQWRKRFKKDNVG